MAREEAPEDVTHRQRVEQYRAAVLVDKFGLRPWEIARLTDKQILGIYFHARDEYGVLVPPTRTPTRADFGTRYDPPESLDAELKTLADLHAALQGQNGNGLTNYAAAAEQIRAKWADGSRQRQRAAWEAGQKGAASND